MKGTLQDDSFKLFDKFTDTIVGKKVIRDNFATIGS